MPARWSKLQVQCHDLSLININSTNLNQKSDNTRPTRAIEEDNPRIPSIRPLC